MKTIIAMLTKRNVGTVDRTIRVIIGLLAFGAVLAAPASTGMKTVFGIVAFLMFFTAFQGACAVYYILGVSTCPKSQS